MNPLCHTARFSLVGVSLVGVLICMAPVSAGEFRSIDGVGNNTDNPSLDATHDVPLIRLFDSAYEDGISVPRGGDPSSLPSPRRISNVVADQTESVTNFLQASDWLWQWGQFLDHDLDLTGADGVTGFDIPVPLNDGDFNPGGQAGVVIPFTRSITVAGTGTGVGNPLEQPNEITGYIDGSNVYGSDASRAAALRGSGGMLATSLGDNGEILLPRNSDASPQPNDQGPFGSAAPSGFFLAGDVRANEQLGLTAAHTLFVREHNRVVDQLQAALAVTDGPLSVKLNEALNDPGNGIDDEADFLYESARKLVGAQIQKITYEEFLPLLIGDDLAGYTGYDSSVDARLSTEFSSAAFRLGHTLLSPNLQRPGVGAIPLANSFFSPGEVQQNGIDALLLGLASQEAQEIDNLLVDGVRNFLFGAPGSGGLDLASLNLQRGRDHGLPGYAEVHNEVFGTSIDSFDDLGSSGLGLIADDVVALLEEAYETVDQIDLWIGGISELADDHGGLLGPTFTFLIADQFGRTRDGDRFFYEDDATLEHLLVLDPTFSDTLLSDIILRNSSIGSIRTNVFVIPEPATLALTTIMAAAALAARRRRG